MYGNSTYREVDLLNSLLFLERRGEQLHGRLSEVDEAYGTVVISVHQDRLRAHILDQAGVLSIHAPLRQHLSFVGLSVY